MKVITIYKLILISLFSLSLIGCNDNDNLPDNDKDKDENIIIDPYMSPSAPQGQITIIGSSKRPIPYLGAGYDIMGGYMDNRSVKGAVLDLSKMEDIDIMSIRVLSNYGVSYEGTTVKELLESIREMNDFKVPIENKGDHLFTETINGEHYFNTPYEYSSQYTFVSVQSVFVERKKSIAIIRSKELLPYLSEHFREALEYSSAKDIIEEFGTHVLKTVHLGHITKAFYRSVVASEENNAIEAALEGLEDRRSIIYKIPYVTNYPSEELIKKNIGGTIVVEFLGGDFQKLPRIQLLPNQVIGEPMDIKAWLASLNESNRVLTALSGDDLIPIYELVTDPIKKQQIKEAVSAHISAKQLDIVETIPIFQLWNGKQHRYFTSYKDFNNRSDGISQLDGAIGSLFVQKSPETVPLYLYSNGKNERFSLSAELKDRGDMNNLGIAGYVYKEYQNISFNVVYEITNGHSYAYTTEFKETYGEKGTWKKTGNEFYSKKISL